MPELIFSQPAGRVYQFEELIYLGTASLLAVLRKSLRGLKIFPPVRLPAPNSAVPQASEVF
jgi:hypothetical protein